MSARFHELRADGIRVTVDLAVGHLRSLEIERDGRRLTPLYTAPWVDDPKISADESILPNLRFLSGDFFCAPFGGPNPDNAPSHGWPANSPWNLLETVPHPEGGTVARFALQRSVHGARLLKELTVRDSHPFVYELHVFEGGSGAISVASHAMTKFTAGGRLSFSPKAYAETPPKPLEGDPARGRHALAYPATIADPGAAPLAAGGTTDLRRYPIAERHEDFVMLVEEAGSRLGWFAALRDEADDIVLSLKDPRDLPVTMLWFSNGGRDYAPWNGRNVGVLGIEEGRAWSANGYAASAAPNPLSQSGIPTVLQLQPGGTAEVRHVVGGLPRPAGWAEVTAVRAADGTLELSGRDGSSISVPFDGTFLNRD